MLGVWCIDIIGGPIILGGIPIGEPITGCIGEFTCGVIAIGECIIGRGDIGMGLGACDWLIPRSCCSTTCS